MPLIKPLTGLLLIATATLASAGSFYATSGGWVYDAMGTVTSGSQLDFKNDLNLKTTDKGEFTLGYIPAKLGWIPGLDFGYVHLAAEGMQNIPRTVRFGVLPLPERTPIATSAAIDDFDASIRWPWVWQHYTISGGVTVARLKGAVVVADSNTGAQNRQPIEQTFPLLSIGASYTPIESLRFNARGDYIQYSGDSAQTIEAGVFYKFFGPVGLEAGWRQRRFKINSGNGYNFDARLSGARIALRFEFSR